MIPVLSIGIKYYLESIEEDTVELAYIHYILPIDFEIVVVEGNCNSFWSLLCYKIFYCLTLSFLYKN
jgi:hypothetical protein